MAMAAERRLPDGFHEKSRIEEVRLASLQIDRSYQREPSQALVDDITENWDEVASELVLVSDRGDRPEESGVKGGLWLVNGQHRSLAARKRNHETIWARVVDLKDEEDPGAVEAELRLKLNVKMSDRPLEKFKAKIRAGNEEALEIVEILGRFDTEINQVPTIESGINAVSTVELIHRGELLYDTIAVLKDSYDHLAGRNVSAAMMRSVAWFIQQHSFEVDRYRFVEKLRLTGTEALFRRAITYQSTMGGSLWMNYYRVFVEMYNEKLAQKNQIEVRLRGAGTFGGREGSQQKGAVSMAWMR